MELAVEAYRPFCAMNAVLDLARYPADGAAGHDVVVRAMREFAAASGEPAPDGAGGIDPAVASGARVLTGERISFAAFLGPGYDIDRDEVRLFDYAERARSSRFSEGLAYALLDPPYGLRRPAEPWAARSFSAAFGARESSWMRDVLRAFCRDVLAIEDLTRTEHLVIQRWPTDWASYFDAGHDWWGAFCWTIEDARHGWVTVVAASTTD